MLGYEELFLFAPGIFDPRAEGHDPFRVVEGTPCSITDPRKTQPFRIGSRPYSGMGTLLVDPGIFDPRAERRDPFRVVEGVTNASVLTIRGLALTTP